MFIFYTGTPPLSRNQSLLFYWFAGWLVCQLWLLFGGSALMTSTLSLALHLTCLHGLRFVTSCAATLPMYKFAVPPSSRNTPTMKQPLLAYICAPRDAGMT